MCPFPAVRTPTVMSRQQRPTGGDVAEHKLTPDQMADGRVDVKVRNERAVILLGNVLGQVMRIAVMSRRRGRARS